MAWRFLLVVSHTLVLSASAVQCGTCEDCHALMRRPDHQDFLGGSSQFASESLLERRLQCSPKDEIAVVDSASNAESKRCEQYCNDNCRAEPPRKQSSEVPCVSKSKPNKLSLAQLSTAYALTGCPEPKPCICQCFCDPIMYGTPLPLPPTPFATGAPPVLSLLGKKAEMKKVKAAEVTANRALTGSLEQVGFGNEATELVGVEKAVEPRPIVLGPMAPPLPPLPPPPDRSFCPKSAACNCFCPCRE